MMKVFRYSSPEILKDDMKVAKSIGTKVPADLKESGQDYFSKSGETRELGE